MNVLLWIFFFACLITLILGMVNPKVFRKKNGQIATRKQIAIPVTIFLVIFFILAIATSKSDSQDNSNQSYPQVSTTQEQTQKVPSNIKAVSTDPCSQYYGTSQLGDCMKLQKAMDKGVALDHPLKAKVTYDSNAIYIVNMENVEWDQCTATVNDSDPSGDNFQSDGFVVNLGETAAIRWADIVNAESQRFDYSHVKPYSLDLDCVVGGKTDKNTGAFSGGQHHRSLFNL